MFRKRLPRALYSSDTVFKTYSRLHAQLKQMLEQDEEEAFIHDAVRIGLHEYVIFTQAYVHWIAPSQTRIARRDSVELVVGQPQHNILRVQFRDSAEWMIYGPPEAAHLLQKAFLKV